MKNDIGDKDLEYLIQSLHFELKRGKANTNKYEIDWNTVKLICLKIADVFLKKTDQFRYPTSVDNIEPIILDEICSLQNIEIENYSNGNYDTGRLQGEIFPTTTGFIVKLNPTQSSTRIFATLAHEVGHSLFYDTSNYPPKRVYFHLSSEEEWICWDFARSILLPTSIMNFILEKYPKTPSATEIVLLSKKLGVSVNFFLKRVRWDLKAWDDSSLIIGYLTADDLVIEDIHKSIHDKNLTVKGKNGILQNELQETLLNFIKNHDSLLEKKIYVKNNLYQLEFCNLNLISDRFVGILKRVN
jgi:hypothetical protein